MELRPGQSVAATIHTTVPVSGAISVPLAAVTSVEFPKSLEFVVHFTLRVPSTSSRIIGLLQFREFRLDLLKIRKLAGVIVHLGVLDHSIATDEKRGTLGHSGEAEIQLRKK